MNTSIYVILTILFLIFILYICDFYLLLSKYNNKLEITNDTNDILRNNNKKTCLLISGQIRDSYEAIFKSQYHYFIKPYNADIFCVFSDDVSEDIKKDVKNILNPKKILWVKDYEKKFPTNLPKNYYLMTYKIYLCNELKKEYCNKNNIHYDVQMRIRPDIVLKSYLPNSIFKNNIANTLYSPKLAFYDRYTNIYNKGLCDQIWISNDDVMNKSSSLYNYLLYDQISDNDCKCLESLFLYYIKILNINISYFYPYLFIISHIGDKFNESIFDSLQYFGNKDCKTEKCIKI